MEIVKSNYSFEGFEGFVFFEPETLPKNVQEKYYALSEFFNKKLENGQQVFITYHVSNEINIHDSKNITETELNELGRLIYDFVVYDKPLPS